VVSPGGENVHVVYDAGGSVLYSASQDGGENWTDPAQIDYGNCPSIALYATDKPTVVYNHDNSVLCKMRRADGTWRDGIVYPSGPSEVVGPPAVAQPPVAQSQQPNSPYCAFAVYDNVSSISRVWLVKLDTLTGFLPRFIAEAPIGLVDSFVSIACIPGGPVQVAWVRSGQVFCASVLDGGIPAIEIVSQAPANHPFVETYGEWVYLVWRDLQSGSVIMRSKQVGGA